MEMPNLVSESEKDLGVYSIDEFHYHNHVGNDQGHSPYYDVIDQDMDRGNRTGNDGTRVGGGPSDASSSNNVNGGPDSGLPYADCRL